MRSSPLWPEFRIGSAALCLLLCWTTQAGGAGLNTQSGIAARPFELDDYFLVTRISEVALTEDGGWVAYMTERPSLVDSRLNRIPYVQRIGSGGNVFALPELQDAHDLTWIPHAQDLAFLSSRNEIAQVFAYNIATRKVRQLTRSIDPVVAFQPAPIGGDIAYLALKRGETLYHRMRSDGSGILIDTDNAGYNEFTDPDFPAPAKSVRLWLLSSNGNTRPIDIHGEAQYFSWSSDARWLSVAYIPSGLPPSIQRAYCTSIGLLNTHTDEFRVFAAAVQRSESSSGRMYSGGEWIPGKYSIVLRRITDPNLWVGDVTFPALAVADVTTGWDDSRASWFHAEIYPRDSRVVPVDASTIFIETRLRATDTLLVLKDSELRPAGIAAGPRSHFMFRFSADFGTTAFVSEGLSAPPELWVKVRNDPARQITNLNSDLSHRILPHVREVSWISRDGTQISGWLYTPSAKSLAKPWPLLTYVHGGPGYAFPNRFWPGDENWPYPFDVLALRGIAVFIPQYRGTLSFGQKVSRPLHIDAEPIDDIASGIEFLTASGIADEKRLGLAGHSHGGWLGAMVAAKLKIFRAASFSEGWSNHVTLYETLTGELNREVHERGIGEPSLYDRPERYLDLSPDLHFEAMPTALLFEAGMDAMQMLGMAKAARHFDIPSEFIVYPRTDHAMTIPHLKREAAETNLDWFRFWLQGKEDLSTAKVDRYRRWRELRTFAREPQLQSH